MSLTDRNTRPASGRIVPAPIWALRKAKAKVRSQPMTSPVERISGPRTGSTPGKRAKGRTASLTLNQGVFGSARVSGSARGKRAVGADAGGVGGAHREVRQGLTGHQAGGDGGDGAVGGLGDEGHGAAGAGVHFKDVDHAVLDRELDVHQADDVQREGHLDGLAFQFLDGLGSQLECGGRQQAESPEWTPASSICSMIPATCTSLPSLNASTSTSMRTGEIAVQRGPGCRRRPARRWRCSVQAGRRRG